MSSPEIALQQFEALADQLRGLIRVRDRLITETREIAERQALVDAAIKRVEKGQLMDGAAFGKLTAAISQRRARIGDTPSTATAVKQKREYLGRKEVGARREARLGRTTAFLQNVAAATLDQVIDGTGARPLLRGFAIRQVQKDLDDLVMLGQIVALGDGRYAIRK